MDLSQAFFHVGNCLKMRCLGAQFPQPLPSQSAPSWGGQERRAGVARGGRWGALSLHGGAARAPGGLAQRRPAQKVAFPRRARALHQSPLPSVPVPPPSVRCWRSISDRGRGGAHGSSCGSKPPAQLCSPREPTSHVTGAAALTTSLRRLKIN